MIPSLDRTHPPTIGRGIRQLSIPEIHRKASRVYAEVLSHLASIIHHNSLSRSLLLPKIRQRTQSSFPDRLRLEQHSSAAEPLPPQSVPESFAKALLDLERFIDANSKTNFGEPLSLPVCYCAQEKSPQNLKICPNYLFSPRIISRPTIPKINGSEQFAEETTEKLTKLYKNVLSNLREIINSNYQNTPKEYLLFPTLYCIYPIHSHELLGSPHYVHLNFASQPFTDPFWKDQSSVIKIDRIIAELYMDVLLSLKKIILHNSKSIPQERVLYPLLFCSFANCPDVMLPVSNDCP